MKLSLVTQEQWLKIFKALGYSFASAFVFVLSQSGKFDKATLYASAIAGVNATLVTIKQLFTPAGR